MRPHRHNTAISPQGERAEDWLILIQPDSMDDQKPVQSALGLPWIRTTATD